MLSTMLCAMAAVAMEPAPADTVPGPDAGLRILLETETSAGYRWPRARGELSEILASRLRLKAALRDTVSALSAAHQVQLAAADARADTLGRQLEHAQLVERWRQELRPGWLARLWAELRVGFAFLLGAVAGVWAAGG